MTLGKVLNLSVLPFPPKDPSSEMSSHWRLGFTREFWINFDFCSAFDEQWEEEKYTQLKK